MGQTGYLGQRQGVHVRTQADHAIAALASLDDADDASSANALHHFITAERTQFLRDRGGGPVHIEEQLGVLMVITPPPPSGLHIVRLLDDVAIAGCR